MSITTTTSTSTNPCLYEMNLLPMVPVVINENEVKYDENKVPYIGCDKRALVNFYHANTSCIHHNFDKYGNTQLEINYTDNDLDDDLCGLELAIYAEKNNHLKELQAHKDLLDHVSFLHKLGDMTSQDVHLTKNSVHNKLKDGHNPFYKWNDLSIFPKELMKEIKDKLIKNKNICRYLHDKYKMWYISFQGTRFIMMSHREDDLEKCYHELKLELQDIASGEWIDEEYGTTERYERIKTRIDLELSNIEYIADTWGTTYDEAEETLYNEAEDELRKEQGLCMFALTGDYIIVPENIPKFKSDEDIWYDNLEKVKEFMDLNNKIPSHGSNM